MNALAIVAIVGGLLLGIACIYLAGAQLVEEALADLGTNDDDGPDLDDLMALANAVQE